MDERVKRDNQIEQTDSLIRQAIDQLEDALYISDLRTGKLDYLNTKVEPITGFSVQELQEMGVQGARERIHPEDRERYLAGLGHLIERGGSEMLEYRWLHKDGTYRWLRNRRQVVRDDQGEPIALVGTLRDITEQRRAEETLWEAEAFNTAILDTTGALIVVLDPQGRMVRFNRACEEITGYSAEEVIGRVIWEFLIPPEQVEGVRDTFVYLRERGLPNRHENDWLTRDGGRRRIAWSNTVSQDERGNLRYIVSSGLDVTEQRVAEQELRESEERFRALYEQAAVGIKLVGLDGRIQAANQKLADILGYTQQELIGREMDDFIAPEDLPAERKARAQLMTGEISSYTLHKRYLWRGTQPIWVRATTSLAHGMREPYRICVVEDITEQKKFEQALSESEERFRGLVEPWAQAIWELNAEGELVTDSPSWRRYTGQSWEESRGCGWINAVHPDDRAYVEQQWREAVATGANVNVEFRLRGPDGEWRWTNVRVVPLRNPDGSVRKWVGMNIDITERKQAEQALRKSEDLFRSLLENSRDGIHRLNLLTGQYDFMSPSMERLSGYTLQELAEMSQEEIMENMHPEDREPFLRYLQEAQDNPEAMRPPIEYRIRSKSGEYRWFSDNRTAVTDAEGRVVALVATSRDVTEQKRAEHALRESEERLRDVLENSRDIIYRYNLRTRSFEYVSPAIEALTGYTPEEMLASKDDPTFWVHPDDVQSFQEHTDSLMHSDEERPTDRVEFRWRTRKGWCWFSVQRVLVRGAQGQPLATVGSMRDVTEQRQAEEAVRENQALLQAIMGGSPDPIFIKDRQGRIILANPATLATIGKPAEQVLGKTDAEFYGDPDVGRAIMENDQRIMESGRTEVVEEEVLSPEGRRFFLSTKTPWRDAQGRIIGLLGISRDITDRKQTEEALRKSEERFRTIIDASPLAILVVRNSRFVYGNPAASKLLGYAPADLIDLPIEKAIVPAHIEAIRQRLQRVGEGLKNPPQEFAMVRADGSTAEIESISVPLDQPDGPAILVMVNDITERVQAERALRESEERYRTLFEAMTEGFALHEMLYDEQGVPTDYLFLEVNPAFEQQTGLKSADILGRTVKELIPDIEPRWIEQYGKVVQTGAPAQFEAWVTPLERWFSISAFRVKPGRFATIFLDITEQKQAGQALRESEERFREVFTHTRDAIYRLDLTNNRYDYFNPALERITGFTRQELDALNAQTFVERLHPDDREKLAEYLEAVRDGQLDEGIVERANRVEYRWRVKGGEYRWFSDRRTLATKPDGTQAVVGSMVDITERVQAEQALRESEERFREVFTHTRDALYRLDVTNDRYDYANPALEELIGLTSQEMAVQGAQVYAERLHPEDRDRLTEYLEALRDHKLDEGIIERANQVEYRWRLKDGEYHWFSDQRTLVTKPDGTQVLVGSMLDITPVKQSEQRLRELNETLEQRVAERTVQLRALAAELSRAEERERQRLARILHDHLQQLLVAARLNISTMQRRLTEEPLQRAAERVDDVLDEAIRTSRSLTAELSPPVLYDAGLTPALHWLARWIEEKHGLVVEVDAEDLGNQPPEGLRAMLFQATRELLFNVVKHAGVNRARLTLRRVAEDQVELIVRDEGAGFDPTRIGRQEEGGFGLFSIRERLELLGGQMKVVSAPGQGTQVILEVPLRGAEIEAAEEAAEQAAKRMAETGRGRAEERAGVREAAGGPSVQVLLVDDHTIMRQGLARLLQDEGIGLAGQADNGREAIALALMTHPDVILMDVSMPGMDGVEATRRILAELPDVKVIGLSMHEGSEMAGRMREAGAVDYMPKGGDPAALIDAVRRWAQKEQSSPVQVRDK